MWHTNTHLTYIYALAHPQCFRMLVHVKVDEKAPMGAVTTEAKSRCLQPGRERTRAACLSWVLAPPELPSAGRTSDIWPLCLCSGRHFLQGRQSLLNLWAPSQYGKMWFFFTAFTFWWFHRDWVLMKIGGLEISPLFSLKRQLKKKESVKRGVSVSDTGTMTWK